MVLNSLIGFSLKGLRDSTDQFQYQTGQRKNLAQFVSMAKCSFFLTLLKEGTEMKGPRRTSS